MNELWMGRATSEVFGFALGETVLENVHPATACEGEHCVLHNPSEHHMRSWPTVWRGDKRIMERTCPHGVGHPDPDDLAFHIRNERSYVGVHGCDGCCHER